MRYAIALLLLASGCLEGGVELPYDHYTIPPDTASMSLVVENAGAPAHLKLHVIGGAFLADFTAEAGYSVTMFECLEGTRVLLEGPKTCGIAKGGLGCGEGTGCFVCGAGNPLAKCH